MVVGAFVSLCFAALVIWGHWLMARPPRGGGMRPATNGDSGTTPDEPVVPARPTRIVIVGGGFAGVFTASALEKLLGPRDDVEVLLVSRENYFVFQPMLPEIISGTIGIMDTVSPLRSLLPRTVVHVREVESIDTTKQTVRLAPGLHPHAHDVPYDHLVIAPGTVTDFRGLPGLPEHAMPFKNLADALAVRSRVIYALDEADIESEDSMLRRQLLTFVVAGGGFSGVEVVAELNDFVREVARQNYPRIRQEELRVVLVHGTDRILPEVPEKLGLYAQRLLASRGVELRLNARLSSASGDRAVLSDGTVIHTKTLVSTIPSSPHPLVEALKLPKGRGGKIKVDRHLLVEGEKTVWSLGDCALVPTVSGEPCPPTAQHATRQATTLARNLLATIDGGALGTFDFKGLGKMGSLGRHNAVAEIFGISVSGFLAWFLWRTIYLAKLPGWGRRAKVAASWTFDLFLPPELVQLRLGGTQGAAHERFEPGQTVFREGDVGDRIYIVLAGRAEVMRGDRKLAEVGPGEFFGEMALLDSAPRNATIRCKEATTVLGIPKREFGLLAANVPGLRDTFADVMRRRNINVNVGPLPGASPATASELPAAHKEIS
jgi:NADH dehydrogenase